MTENSLSRDQIAWRCAQDISEGDHVNLGIGIPTLISNYTKGKQEVIYHVENGILGAGPRPSEGEEDPDLVNVNQDPVTLVPGGSILNHTDSFVVIRGGHIDITVMGAYEVSESGDIANWLIDPNGIPGIGGAMDLAIGAKKVFVTMKHTTKHGEPKILKECVLPLTAKNVVKSIYTDLCVIDVNEDGLVLREIIPNMSVEELQELTGAPLHVRGEVAPLHVPPL